MFEGHRNQGRASDAMDSSEFKIGCRDLTNRVITSFTLVGRSRDFTL
jgi:hypothetical protein